MDKSKRRTATLIYALILVMSGAVTAPLTPISATVSKVFDQSVPTITLSTTIYSFAGVAFGIPANLLVGKIGIRKSVFVAVLLFTVGTGLRLFFTTNFYFVHAGQAIQGLGSPFVSNAIGGFSAHWYQGSSVRKKFSL